jgi:filamentous hemagglutinin family protein
MTQQRTSRRFHRRALLIGASLATLGAGLSAVPVTAQSARAALALRVNTPRATPQGPGTAPVRSASARAALQRQVLTTSRTAQIRAYVTAARAAAAATNRAPVTEGLSAGGLQPTAIVSEAMAAIKAGDTGRATQLLVAARAVNDPTGTATWDGAKAPVEQAQGDGRTLVSIDQTQERALLSWNSFNVGEKTTLQFNQKANGVAQPGWVAVNRVTNSTAPSQILGNLKADGTVVVVNQRGVIFGRTAQVNTQSLLASSLDIGYSTVRAGVQNRATTIADRNNAFLNGGLFLPATIATNNTQLLVSGLTTGTGTTFAGEVEGDVVVDAGAQLTAGTGGFLMLAAPRIASAGTLNAVDGQVSLQAGRAVSYVTSGGGASDADPNLRGYRLGSYDITGALLPDAPRPSEPADGHIEVRGLIQSRRGYLSLGTDFLGSIEVEGMLASTTSVSRNGKISLVGGTITLAGDADPAHAAAIEILPDANGETIPQGSANAPASFKASQIEIGGLIGPGTVTIGQNAVIHAPAADVRIGLLTPGSTGTETPVDQRAITVTIAAGAVIDVSGIKDVQLAASRNQIQITPVKRNELRDTPNYREVVLDGNFSLNGTTLFVDPRVSGVRADGVAWVGSPLIEAGSLASQISAGADEFMTRGGTVNLLSNPASVAVGGDPAAAPGVRLSAGATIDVSGGWVSYAAGPVRTSRLITNDGRVVDIARANPNDVYVGVAEGFSEVQPRFGVVRAYLNAGARAVTLDAAYDEGRDAGALTVFGPTVSVEGTIHGNAFAGTRQVATGDRATRVSTLPGDTRLLQASPYQLPSGAALSIGSQGDMLVYRGTRGAAAANPAELLLSDRMLNDAGLSQLRLTARGTIVFAGAAPSTVQPAGVLAIAGASQLALAPGGALLVDAGLGVRFDGRVAAPSGTIAARTSNLTLPFAGISASLANLAGAGGALFGQASVAPFDITVTGALSTAGLWVNDFTAGDARLGGAFSDGGAISLTVQPRFFQLAADGASVIDRSGSIRVAGTLDVSAGGYVTPDGGLVLDGAGGDLSLVNATVYARSALTAEGLLTNSGVLTGGPGTSLGDRPIGGSNQTVDFTPLPASGTSDALVPQLVPDAQSVVDIAGATIRGFGFAQGGGGTFTLVSPDVSFGSDVRAGSTHIGLDVFQRTGFGTLDVSTTRSRIIADLFTNDSARNSALLETTRFTIGAGETLDLTQWVLPSILTAVQADTLRTLATGTDLAGVAALPALVPAAAFDRRAAKLVVGGLAELDVLAGGRITGAAGASVTAVKLYNAGTIVIAGGTVAQGGTVTPGLQEAGLGVRDVVLGGQGLAEALGGDVDAQGRFDEAALNAAGVTTGGAAGRVLTNAELFTRDGVDRLVYFLGLLDQSQGMVLAAGSVTDLSGTAVFDPRAQVGTTRLRAGRVLDGGTIRTAAVVEAQRRFGLTPTSIVRTLERDDAARVDISGTSAVFDQSLLGGRNVDYLEWSAAGTIAALGGGTLGTTPIAARGGVAQAQGGTLEWLRPTIGSGDGAAADYLAAGVITASGFDSVLARGSATLDGAFDLSLRKSFAVTSQDATGNADRNEAYVSVAATAGTQASITAGHVRFASILGIAGASFAPAGDAAVTFAAAQGIDVAGGVLFDRSIADLTLTTAGDARLIGVDSPVNANPTQAQYDGQLVAGGNLTIDARRTYATTGTGNLQGLLEGQPAAQTNAFDILALDGNAITFGNTYLERAAPAPLSAGAHLRVLARTIVQNGWLAAPLGLLEIGSNQVQQPFPGNYASTPTETVTFGAGSVTSVSGAGLLVPYGTTTDGIEYFFPTVGTPITRIPTAELRLAGGSIDVAEGALVDGRGGGDVFGYEFQSGVGGSRDVLDRFNNDAFSSNAFDPVTGRGYQFADQRQVFALVPLDQANRLAGHDPVYSADYGATGPVDLYGAAAGRTVRLEGGEGVAAGDYLLVPAKYARTVPGALRLVENTDAAVPLPGQTQRLLDGSVVVAGTFGYAASGIAESTRRGFTVQSRDVFLRYSQIAVTSGSQTVVAQAAKLGNDRPRIALDAARVILSPLESLRVAGAFETGAAAGGRGGEFDVLGADILIAARAGEGGEGVLTLTGDTLTRLNAASLLIGGTRAETASGATRIDATAAAITVGAGATLTAPELLFAVAGTDSRITVADGAVLRAADTLENQSGADYLAAGAGSLLRLAAGPERLVTRTGAGGASAIEVGAATLAGQSLALDTSGDFAVGDAALDVRRVAVSGQAIGFADGGGAGTIGAALEARLAAAERLTVRSGAAIRFAGGAHRFGGLVLDGGGIAAVPGADATVAITADDVRLQNTRGVASGCATLGACGAGALTLEAATLSFGAGAFDVGSFADGVTLAAANGMYVEGKGSLVAGEATLTLATPFLADRALVADPRDQKVRPDYAFLTRGDVALTGRGIATPSGASAPGARLTIGSDEAAVASARIEGVTVRATGGIIDIRAAGDVTLAGATLATPGYEQTFGDAADAVTVAAGGGTVNVVARDGDLSADAASTFVTDTGTGSAGTLNLLAGRGALTLAAAINPGVEGARAGSLTLDSGTGALDLGVLATDRARLFGGDVAIRSGVGDLSLGTGQAWRARSIALTADGGAVRIAGTLDTSGVDVAGLSAEQARDARVNGGDIALWGAGGVSLAPTARLDTHTSGYAEGDTRAASAGDVSIGIARADAAITIAAGAVIDAGARRAQADGAGVGRLVPQTLTDPASGAAITVYRYVEPDTGGIVRFRAPVVGAGEDRVAVSLGGAIPGADSVQLEAFKRWDLDALADSALYSGVTRAADGTLVLDMAQGSAATGLLNPFTEDGALADGSASLVRFIRGFGVTTLDGSSLTGVRVRPGVELAAAGGVRTASQWNLGAATFSQAQLDAAVAAGDLRVIPEISTDGQIRYAVSYGREASLLENHATFLYRVGGAARGEAPVVTLRAGGDLTVDRSISDGFFTFRDKSDPAYLNYQLGGGDRLVAPAISFSCGFAGGSCAFIPGYADGVANPPGAAGTIAIGLGTTAQRGEQQGGAPFVNSPLALTGNGAAGAVDAAGAPTGDSFGFAELFPLLSDGAAMHASDIRLVGGASATPSADPLRVDTASAADVRVQGEFSYRVAATGTLTYGGALQLRYVVPGADPVVFDLDEALSLDTSTGDLDALRDDAYTTISWGAGTTALASEARAAALAYFAGSGYQFSGTATRQSGITAPLRAILGFLQSFEPTYLSGIASGRSGYSVARGSTVIDFGADDTAYVRTTVRTGDGASHVAAARDADLRGGTQAVYRTATGAPADADSGAQFAAAGVYTAGVRAAAAPVAARIAGTATRVTVTPDSPYLQVQPEQVDFIPSPLALSDTAAVLTRGGGDVGVTAGRDVLGRRDVWSEQSLGQATANAFDEDVTYVSSAVGQFTQRWRTGDIGPDSEAGLLPRYFNGVGALSGGDVTIRAGRDVRELTVALDAGITTTTASAAPTLLTLGRGDLLLTAGRDILAGRVDVASGAARIEAGRDIAAFGTEPLATAAALPQYMRVRLADARVAMRAGGAATLASVSALGVDAAEGQSAGSAGFFSPSAAFALSANEAATIVQTPTALDLRGSPLREYGQQAAFQAPDVSRPSDYVQVLPPSFGLTALLGSVVLPAGQRQFLYPSPIGQLRLFSAGDIANLALVMSDADPSVLGGAFIQPVAGAVTYRVPFVAANTTDAELRDQHNRRPTHLGDDEPVRIHSGGDIVNSALFLPKQARVTATGDIVDLFFSGQNLRPGDVTRVRAGGDIRGTIDVGLLPFVRSNSFVLGGPGTLIVEAGRDLGPFVTSADVRGLVEGVAGQTFSNAGGIRTVGNDNNPWLAADGADLQVRFGMAAGADYAALRESYVNPANLALLDGDLFAQVTDAFGNTSPDRTRPIYAPLLAQWLRDEAPEAFATVFGAQGFADDAALASASYGRFDALYAAFAALPGLRQQDFLINRVYFNELAAPGVPDGPSSLQYIRGYRAVQALFPTRLGYTDNLAPYTLDPSTISADHPLGEPVRDIVNGQPQRAVRIETGNVDLRLATLQTARGGDVTILGPGGDVIAGSIVRTAEQAQRRQTAFEAPRFDRLPGLISGGLGALPSSFTAVPLGFEGVLTLRGGAVRSFTDGDFILNQSRVFTQAGGDITMWSSNGDLNAGQGPKSAANFPPVTVRFDENGLGEVSSAGSVAGAGIGAFQRAPGDPPADVVLIAPVGEVDAGDAGVRASGNIVVAAARVANADNFTAGGDITGVPTGAVTAGLATPQSAASAIAANAATAAQANDQGGNRRSIITVDVLGPASGDGRCADPRRTDDPDCR